MAWVERTFAEVDPPEDGPDEDQQLGEMLRNLPPYMKLTTRRARKALEKYEVMKQRHIENLRQNPLYKFVMQVAAFTNEDIGKYWKGKTLTPFMEDHIPEKIMISSEDLRLMDARAEENAFADLHQFCTRIRAVPMFDTGARKQAGKPRDQSDPQGTPKRTQGTRSPGSVNADIIGSVAREIDFDNELTDGEQKRDSLRSNSGAQSAPRRVRRPSKRSNSGAQSAPPRVREGLFQRASDTARRIRGLPRRDRLNVSPPSGSKKYIYNMNDMEFERFIQRFQNRQYPPAEDLLYYALENNSPDHDESPARDLNPDESIQSLPRSVNTVWNINVPIIRWDDPYAEYWFQRYIARWLRDDTTNVLFRDRYRIMFNNIVNVDGKVYRDLTGMRLTEEDGSGPLGFVQPLFDQRKEWWRHELILGEYEKRSQYQADKWLQKTPWALGKMYIEPKLYGHMVEAHVMVTTRFKKFQNASVEDLVQDEKHSFFLSKLVAMCINTSGILSGKKYGLDRMYMRMNFEKRKLMHAWSKLPTPNRMLRRAPNIVYGRRQLRELVRVPNRR